ncbi:hypothetical protein TeGR_g14301 [Tetraparma gracilis]|uniref:Polymerase nucleotidyl transferase domain-containing protein n=1 Tax=Tetraparma gracilis TaxID=2962635 RepID=A0ABQ6N393_9STRA|nr:hypothetical protein TeGR_g14301 [Tetraparma gracilis]
MLSTSHHGHSLAHPPPIPPPTYASPHSNPAPRPSAARSDTHRYAASEHRYAQSEGEGDMRSEDGGPDAGSLPDDGSAASDCTRSAIPRPLLLSQPSPGLAGPLHPPPSSLCQSRLTRAILSFVAHADLQVASSTPRRLLACARIRRVVSALWPRAQVKLYGSHVTGLALPSSDLDFVIVLPAVHKTELVETPGILEGPNAIRETWQASLARKLRSETWVFTNDIKIIERTLIPVIKIRTNDNVELDISFDGAEHHGLENIALVNSTLAEFPHARPLILVLKQFLQNSGLLTAYTGGLSSYGLFLMTARYLQEQVFAGGMDLGSLLMGFFDFYGNHFNPRVTGLSAGRRCYFDRHEHHRMNWYSQQQQQQQQQNVERRHSFTEDDNYAVADAKPSRLSVGASVSPAPPRPMPFQVAPPPMPTTPPVAAISTGGERRELRRSGSSVGLGGGVDTKRTGSGSGEGAPAVHVYVQRQQVQQVWNEQQAQQFLLDPIFCEDPLSPANNVLRNTFRILQVLRAFSDAHRSLQASLEFTGGDGEEGGGQEERENGFSLLEGILNAEDAFYPYTE